MKHINFLKCRAIIVNEILFDDLFFVTSNDQVIHHAETLDSLVDDDFEEHMMGLEEDGVEPDYQSKVEIRQEIWDYWKDYYLCNRVNQFRVYYN